MPQKGAKAATIRHFKLPTISTLDGILNKKQEIVEAYESGLASSKRKNLKHGKNSELDSEIYEWINSMRSKRIELTAIDIINKRKELGSKDSNQDLT